MAERPGYISIYRKIQDNWLWSDKPFNKALAWIDILLSAQFHDSKVVIGGQVIEVPRGSWFVSVKTLETRWGWSSNKIRTFIRTLERDGMIQTEGTTRGTLLTVVKYEDYQSGGRAKGRTESTSEGTTEGIAEGTSEGRTEGTTEGTHTNKSNKSNKVNKRKNQDPLSAYTFTQEEIDRLDELGDDKAFPNQEIADLYWRKVLQIERGQIERPQ